MSADWIWHVQCLHIQLAYALMMRGQINNYTFRGGTFVKIVFIPSLKWVYSKRKEFAPSGSKFFPFRVDPISQGDFCAREQRGSHAVACTKW